MTRIAYLVTSARELTLADGTQHPTGYFAEEALKPYERFAEAGFDVTVITPDGQPPYADPYGLSWFFNYPEEDKDYLASVVRTFARDVDDIRLTLHQNTELGLAAARRVAALLQAGGRTPAEAHRIVSRAAKIAWQQDRPFADVLAEDTSLGLTREQIDSEVDAQRADSERLSDERLRRLQDIPGFQHPAALSSLTDAETGRIQRGLRAGRPRADGRPGRQPRRGPAAPRAAPQARADRRAVPRPGDAAVRARRGGQWLFDGYRLTSFTDEEEDQTEAGLLGLAWLLDVALKNAGAVFDDGPAAWISHVVVDRNLITGQNPGSTEATADAVIKKLLAPARQAA